MARARIKRRGCQRGKPRLRKMVKGSSSQKALQKKSRKH